MTWDVSDPNGCAHPTWVIDVTGDGKLVVQSTVGSSTGAGGTRASRESFNYMSHVVKGCDQQVAFDALTSRLIQRSRDGLDCTLMAYGQTGSGKTHTMFGPPGCLTEAVVH